MALVRRDEPATGQLSKERRFLSALAHRVGLHQASQNSLVHPDLLLGRSGRSATDNSFNAGITLFITLRIGALIGGWLAGLLGLGSFGLIGTIIVAFIGACILLAILHAVGGGRASRSRGWGRR